MAAALAPAKAARPLHWYMLIRTKTVWMTCGLLVAVILGVGSLLRAIPARPSAAIGTAQSFVDALRVHELERAYQLTTRQGEVDDTLAEFQAVVRQQWPTTAVASVRFEGVHPFQSYGNRLRRWLRGQEADPPQLWLEFAVDGLPFTVRETRQHPGAWKVDFFESHAG